jgi:hypothetical protein
MLPCRILSVARCSRRHRSNRPAEIAKRKDDRESNTQVSPKELTKTEIDHSQEKDGSDRCGEERQELALRAKT